MNKKKKDEQVKEMERRIMHTTFGLASSHAVISWAHDSSDIPD